MKKTILLSLLTGVVMSTSMFSSLSVSASDTESIREYNYVVDINVSSGSAIANAAITTTYNINMLDFYSILEGNAIPDASTAWEGYKQYDGLVCCEYYDTSNAIVSQGTIAQIRFDSAYSLTNPEDYFDVTYSFLKYADGSNVSESYVSVNCYLMGDVNLDGDVTSDDANLVAAHAVGNITLSGNALIAADVNFDGVIDALDATIVGRYSVGTINSFWAW